MDRTAPLEAQVASMEPKRTENANRNLEAAQRLDKVTPALENLLHQKKPDGTERFPEGYREAVRQAHERAGANLVVIDGASQVFEQFAGQVEQLPTLDTDEIDQASYFLSEKVQRYGDLMATEDGRQQLLEHPELVLSPEDQANGMQITAEDLQTIADNDLLNVARFTRPDGTVDQDAQYQAIRQAATAAAEQRLLSQMVELGDYNLSEAILQKVRGETVSPEQESAELATQKINNILDLLDTHRRESGSAKVDLDAWAEEYLKRTKPAGTKITEQMINQEVADRFDDLGKLMVQANMPLDRQHLDGLATLFPEDELAKLMVHIEAARADSLPHQLKELAELRKNQLTDVDIQKNQIPALEAKLRSNLANLDLNTTSTAILDLLSDDLRAGILDRAAQLLDRAPKRWQAVVAANGGAGALRNQAQVRQAQAAESNFGYDPAEATPEDMSVPAEGLDYHNPKMPPEMVRAQQQRESQSITVSQNEAQPLGDMTAGVRTPAEQAMIDLGLQQADDANRGVLRVSADAPQIRSESASPVRTVAEQAMIDLGLQTHADQEAGVMRVSTEAAQPLGDMTAAARTPAEQAALDQMFSEKPDPAAQLQEQLSDTLAVVNQARFDQAAGKSLTPEKAIEVGKKEEELTKLLEKVNLDTIPDPQAFLDSLPYNFQQVVKQRAMQMLNRLSDPWKQILQTAPGSV